MMIFHVLGARCGVRYLVNRSFRCKSHIISDLTYQDKHSAVMRSGRNIKIGAIRPHADPENPPRKPHAQIVVREPEAKDLHNTVLDFH